MFLLPRVVPLLNFLIINSGYHQVVYRLREDIFASWAASLDQGTSKRVN